MLLNYFSYLNFLVFYIIILIILTRYLINFNSLWLLHNLLFLFNLFSDLLWSSILILIILLLKCGNCGIIGLFNLHTQLFIFFFGFMITKLSKPFLIFDLIIAHFQRIFGIIYVGRGSPIGYFLTLLGINFLTFIYLIIIRSITVIDFRIAKNFLFLLFILFFLFKLLIYYCLIIIFGLIGW